MPRQQLTLRFLRIEPPRGLSDCLEMSFSHSHTNNNIGPTYNRIHMRTQALAIVLLACVESLDARVTKIVVEHKETVKCSGKWASTKS